MCEMELGSWNELCKCGSFLTLNDEYIGAHDAILFLLKKTYNKAFLRSQQGNNSCTPVYRKRFILVML